jgi:predicted GNAT superfamily acetyltransferase
MESQKLSDVSVEVCATLPEMRECVSLQRRIWNDPDEDLIPATMLIVAHKVGGQVLLAREDGRPVGFALAIPAFHGELRYLHSHIAGVLPGYQNRGLGQRIKTRQRELALAAGITLMEWTFDPMAVRNAYFNIVKMGAVIDRFCPNLYGVTASPLHGGLPTDRRVASWWMSSPRTESILAGQPPVVAPDALRIEVPAEIEQWKLSDPARAVEVQSMLRQQFRENFANGFQVIGFRMDEGKGIYLLEPRKS